MPELDYTKFAALWRRQEQQREARLELMKQQLAAATAPVSKEFLEELCGIFIAKFIEIIRSHPGFALEDKRRSIETSLGLLKQTANDLTKALENFDAFNRSGALYRKTSKHHHAKIEAKIRKELYCFASLSQSLEDHCRRITKNDWKPTGLQEAIVTHFGSDGLHDFVCGLRVALHHFNMVEADWLIRGTGPDATSHYVLEKQELLIVRKAWRRPGRDYLNSADDRIDVRALLENYLPRALAFYEWFLDDFERQSFWHVIDFRRCWREKMRISSQQEWRLVLQIYLNTKLKIDPFDYLDHFLTVEQIDTAMTLPMRSKEQVDYIISVVDELSACTDEIRAMAYKFFGVGSEWVL